MAPDAFGTRAGRTAGSALLALGAVLLTATVALIAVALVRDDDAEPRAATATGWPELVDRRFGVSIRQPPGWRRAPTRKAIALRSPNRRVALTITTVASAPGATRLRKEVEDGIVSGLDGGRVLERTTAEVGGRRIPMAAITGRDTQGGVVHVLSMTVDSPWRTYAVAAFGDPRADQGTLEVAQAALASLRFSRPGAR